MDTFSLQNGTRGTIPRVPFSHIKEAVLGKKYSLSLVFIGDIKMKRLNNAYRKKQKTTDILSFPLSRDSGEIFISLKEASKRSARFNMTPKQYTTFLFIHGCLHLKGFDHGVKMEALESKWCKHFSVPSPHLLKKQ